VVRVAPHADPIHRLAIDPPPEGIPGIGRHAALHPDHGGVRLFREAGHHLRQAAIKVIGILIFLAISLAGDPIEHTVFGEGIHIHNHSLLTPRLKGRSAA
jgi:hypothetical protein